MTVERKITKQTKFYIDNTRDGYVVIDDEEIIVNSKVASLILDLLTEIDGLTQMAEHMSVVHGEA